MLIGTALNRCGANEQSVPLTGYAWLSILAAIVYAIIGSVGLLPDAIESFVNLAVAIVALIALHIVTRLASDEFTFGYSKVEYFSFFKFSDEHIL